MTMDLCEQTYLGWKQLGWKKLGCLKGGSGLLVDALVVVHGVDPISEAVG
jgi:hypothetical protein